MCASFLIRATAFKSLLRLLQGSFRWDCHVNQTFVNNPKQIIPYYRILSIDLFDTLLLRTHGIEHTLRLSISHRMVTDLNIPDLSATDILGMLGDIEADMRNNLLLTGLDPEISRRASYKQLLQNLAVLGDSGEMAQSWVDFELDQLALNIRLNPIIVELVESANAAGERVIAISDMHYSAQELAVLLKNLGAPSLGAIYVSSDIGFSKFRGGLYDYVLESEGIGPEEMLHIGDNRWSDVFSARQKGIKSLHYRPVKFSEVRRSRQLSSGPEYCLGYSTLGPIFAAFAHLLLLQSQRLGVKHLAFVARDGDLLKQVTECLASHSAFFPQPRFHYLYLSRRSTALLSVDCLGEAELAKVAYIRSGGSLLKRFLDYFGLSDVALSTCLARHGLDLNDENIRPEAISPLLDDPCFQRHVESEHIRQMNLLSAYLHQQEMFDGEPTALVDIGWRGSIQESLSKAFPDIGKGLQGLYFGFWNESGLVGATNSRCLGIISDIQRRRSLLEASAWYAAFILEALCREDCGTVIGYSLREDAKVFPLLTEDAQSREEERKDETCRLPIRQGILDYIGDYAKYGLPALPQEKNLKCKAQFRLLRLAFFPTRAEIDILGSLSQTEGHAPAWSHPLISQDRPNPCCALRRWLTGLSSPWRFGYVAATGGYPLAFLCIALEACMLACPSSLRESLRNLALGLAK